MSRRLLLLAAVAAAVFSSPPVESVYLETRYAGRNYFCRDRRGFTGDCADSRLRSDSDYDYGYREDKYGRNVGQGFYNMIGDYDAEMICDFSRDGRVRGDVEDIVWWKVYDDDDNFDRRRDRDYRRGSDFRRDRDYRRGRDFRRDRDYRRYDSRARRRDDFDDYRRRSYDRRDDSRYRYSYRRHVDDADQHYRRARQFRYRPGRLRDDDYINDYKNWYDNDNFRSSLRVTTRGDRSTLYIRDIQPDDLGLYRCQGRMRSSDRYRRQRDDDMVYMDVEFHPIRKYD